MKRALLILTAAALAVLGVQVAYLRHALRIRDEIGVHL